VVTIPVIGNGDVETPEDAKRMWEETGCDAVMVGRAAMGNPWLFGDIRHYCETGEHRAAPTLAARIDGALFHLKTMAADPAVGEERAVKEMRGQITHYFKGFPGVSALRGLIVKANTIAEIEDLLHHESQQSR
jgi:tRNA-dihydrouridine synthase B